MINPVPPFTVKNSSEIWQLVEKDIHLDTSFEVNLIHDYMAITLEMKIDPGTGLSRSGEFTGLTSNIPDSEDFEFTIKDADPLDLLRKIFSKNRVSTGIKTLDKRLVIRSNNEGIVRQLFSYSEISSFFNVANDFSFGIYVRNVVKNGQKKKQLHLRINTAINTPSEFKLFYNVFYIALGIIVPH